MDYVVSSCSQLTVYAGILTSQMGTPEADGNLPKSRDMIYDIFIHSPLPSVRLRLTDSKETITYRRNGNVLDVHLWNDKANDALEMQFEADDEDKIVLLTKPPKSVSGYPVSVGAKKVRQVMLMYNTVQSLMIEPQKYAKKIKEPVNQSKKAYKYKPSKKVYVYHIVDADESKAKRLGRTVKKKEWRSLAWRVRGHWRHYKSGHRVFIKAYVKGKNKDDCIGREYVLTKD